MFEKNLIYLRKYFPHYASLIENLADDGTVREINTISGHKILQKRDNASTWFNLDSTINPFDKVNEQLKEIREKQKTLNDWLFLGLGSGYEVLEFCKTTNKGFVILVEPDLQIFKKNLEIHDYSVFFNQPQKMLFLTHQKVEFSNQLFDFLTKTFLPNISIEVNYFAKNIYGHIYQTFCEAIQESINRFTINVATSSKFGKRFAYNMLRNLPMMLQAGDEAPFKNAFANKPVVVIAAGPSLEDSLPELKEIQNKAVLIAVDSALKSLLDYGIEPHFVATIDIHSPKRVIFREVANQYPNSRFILNEIQYTHPLISNSFKGRKLFLWVNSPISDFLETAFETRYKFGECLSCSHAAFYFAQYIGGDPIILVGQDLCFSKGDKLRHVKGSIGTHSQTREAARYKWENDKGKCYVMGNDGKQYQSIRSLAAFITTFEAAISTAKTKIYNATKIGAKIEGAEWTTFEKLKQSHFKQEYDIWNEINSLYKVNNTEASRKLGLRLKEFERYVKNSIHSLKQFKTVIEDAKYIIQKPTINQFEHKRLAELEKLRVKLEGTLFKEDQFGLMIRQPLLQLSLEVRRLDQKINELKNQKERALAVVDRYKLISKNFEGILQFYAKLLIILNRKLKEVK